MTEIRSTRESGLAGLISTIAEIVQDLPKLRRSASRSGPGLYPILASICRRWGRPMSYSSFPLIACCSRPSQFSVVCREPSVSPLAIETGVSAGRGSGQIIIDREMIAPTLAGTAKGRGIMRFTDPIRIGGTFSSPSITIAGLVPTKKPCAQAVLKVLERLIDAALGLRKDAPQAPNAVAQSSDCQSLTPPR